MFEEAAKKEPEDIFSQTEGVPQPSAPTAPPAPSTPPPAGAMPPVRPSLANLPPSSGVPAPGPVIETVGDSGGKTWKTVVIAVLILAVIAAAAGISFMLLSSRAPISPELEQVINPPTESIPNVEPEPAPVVPMPDPDDDKDGLTNLEEAQLGTDPASADTDQDGLYDLEELQTYQTNPLNPDTDGDGYNDGEEVKGGYNPNGEGKLLQIPAAS